MSLAAVSELYARAKTVMTESQSSVDTLVSFLTARAALEDSYSKALAKLAKNNLSVNEKSMDPTLYEAIVSMHGDVTNESVQHKELATSINADVLEPLKHLKESSDMVARVTTEARRATKDVKSAYEKSKRSYQKYVQLYRRCTETCLAAGMAPPDFWDPVYYKPNLHKGSESSRRPSGTASVSSVTTDTAAAKASSKPQDTGEDLGCNQAKGKEDVISPVEESFAHAAEQYEGVTGNHVDYGLTATATTSAGLFRTSGGRSSCMSNIEERLAQSLNAPLVDPALQRIRREIEAPAGPPLSNATQTNATQQTNTHGTPLPQHKGGRDEEYVSEQEYAVSTPPGERAHGHSVSAPPGGSSPLLTGSNSRHGASGSVGILGSFSDMFKNDELADLDSIPRSDSFAGLGPSAEGDSFDDGTSIGSADVSGAAWSHRISRFASMWSVGANPAVDNGSGLDKLDLLRNTATALLQAVDSAKQECEEAWDAHARARAAFLSQMTAAVTIFQEIEKKRVTEMCDSLRKYSIYFSSMLANLQYDVQRLAVKIEDAGNTATGQVAQRFELAVTGSTILETEGLASGGTDKSTVLATPTATPRGHQRDASAPRAAEISQPARAQEMPPIPPAGSSVARFFRFGGKAGDRPKDIPRGPSPLVPRTSDVEVPAQPASAPTLHAPTKTFWSRLGGSPSAKSVDRTPPNQKARGSRTESMDNVIGVASHANAAADSSPPTTGARLDDTLLRTVVDALFDPSGNSVSEKTMSELGLDTFVESMEGLISAGGGERQEVAHLSFQAFASGSSPPSVPAASSSSVIPTLHVPAQADINPQIVKLYRSVVAVLRRHDDGLNTFVKHLESKRADGIVLTVPSFSVLCRLLDECLTLAYIRRDFTHGRSIMVMAQTFYCYMDESQELDDVIHWFSDSDVPAGSAEFPARRSLLGTPIKNPGDGDAGPTSGSKAGRRVYLQAALRGHKIWSDLDFWEAAVIETVRHDAAKTRADTKPDPDMIVMHLGFFAFNMIAFGVPVDSVKEFLSRYSKSARISSSGTAQLLGRVEELAVEQRRQDEQEAIITASRLQARHGPHAPATNG